MADKVYVVRGMKAKCSSGSMANYLNVETGHGVLFSGEPLLNANDHLPGINITPFGDCSSKQIFVDAQEELQVQADDRFLAVVGKTLVNASPLKQIFNGVQDIMCRASKFKKCEMEVPRPWMFENAEYSLDGAGALTMESQCACIYGGTISITIEVDPVSGETAGIEG